MTFFMPSPVAWAIYGFCIFLAVLMWAYVIVLAIELVREFRPAPKETPSK